MLLHRKYVVMVVGLLASCYTNADAQDLFLQPRVVQSSRQCTVKESTDVAVTHYRRVAVKTVEECCAACAGDSRCKVAVLHGDHCNLKDHIRLVNSGNDFVAIIPGSAPAPSPTPGATCNVGDTVHCPGGDTMCAGNQCCRDGSACPSAEASFHSCPKAKATDCTSPFSPPSPPVPTPPPPPSPTPGPSPPMPAGSVEWKVALGNNWNEPQLLLNVGSGFAPFQLRGVDYSPNPKCCVNSDLAAFQEDTYKRDLPRMAAMGLNTIKLYGMCDGVLDGSNICGAPPPGCGLKPVTVDGVRRFLDFAYEHRMFVLLSNRAFRGSVEAFAHMARTYGAHPAVAGAILYDESLDMGNFNAAAKALHYGFAQALGKDPAATAVENVGRIITTAAHGQVLQRDFHERYGQFVNVWGWDPYARLDERNDGHDGRKPIMITENGINGGYPGGCRDDCSSGDCTRCEKFRSPWKSYMKWLENSHLAGHFTFEWTSENWKGRSDACRETHSFSEGNFNEGNYGMFQIEDNGQLRAKSIGWGETFESVFSEYGNRGPTHGGFHGWL